jgi:hypothetical protein
LFIKGRRRKRVITNYKLGVSINLYDLDFMFVDICLVVYGVLVPLNNTEPPVRKTTTAQVITAVQQSVEYRTQAQQALLLHYLMIE